MHRKHLLTQLAAYRPLASEPAHTAQRLSDFVQQHENCFERSLAVGHITGSAWIISPDSTQILLTHHRKLNRWLQLGGHADGQNDVLAVAMREAHEESGVAMQHIRPLQDSQPFDIDIHAIPERGDDPKHWHYDVRYLLEIDPQQPLQISAESNDLAWVPIDQLHRYSTDPSMLRMRDKIRAA